MNFFNLLQIYENKDSRINKLVNLTDEQKEEVKAFFNKHNEQEKFIDWNNSNLTYDDFKAVIDNFNNRFLPKYSLKDLKEGEDYITLGDYDSFKFYLIKTYKASVAFASNNIGPEIWSPLPDWYTSVAGDSTNWKDSVKYDYPQKISEDNTVLYGGAKWCISMNHTDKFWKEYTYIEATDSITFFIFAIGNDEKYAIQTEYQYSVTYNSDDNNDYDENQEITIVDIFNGYDISDDSYTGRFNDFLGTRQVLKNLYSYIDEFHDKFNRKLKNIEEYKDTLPTINFKLHKDNYPFFKIGTKQGNDIFMSRYIFPIEVPCCPQYISEDGRQTIAVYRWDTCMLRQWLNSDEPAGQWYHAPQVDGYKIKLNSYEKYFTEQQDGFLKQMGISKSDLNLVENYTKNYINDEPEEIVTNDYVWIPTSDEIGRGYSKTEPFDFWSYVPKMINSSEIYKFRDESDKFGYEPYPCRDNNKQSNIYYISAADGYLSSQYAIGQSFHVVILMSPKSKLMLD